MRPQLWVFLVAAGSIVLILLLPLTPSEESISAKAGKEIEGSSLDSLLEGYKSGLDAGRLDRIATLEAQLEEVHTPDQKAAYLDSLALAWKVLGKPDVEVEYRQMAASESQSVAKWFEAGDLYFNLFRSAPQQRKAYMITQAIASYEKVLELDPENLGALNALGVSHVEGAAFLGEPPMKGIGMIKQVLEKDPKNIDALINLGYFAIQSNQFEKATQRFEQVLEIDSTHIEAYLYLTDVYLSQDQVDRAIESLESYKRYVEDPTKRDQIDEYIKTIKEK